MRTNASSVSHPMHASWYNVPWECLVSCSHNVITVYMCMHVYCHLTKSSSSLFRRRRLSPAVSSTTTLPLGPILVQPEAKIWKPYKTLSLYARNTLCEPGNLGCVKWQQTLLESRACYTTTSADIQSTALIHINTFYFRLLWVVAYHICLEPCVPVPSTCTESYRECSWYGSVCISMVY